MKESDGSCWGEYVRILNLVFKGGFYIFFIHLLLLLVLSFPLKEKRIETCKGARDDVQDTK